MPTLLSLSPVTAQGRRGLKFPPPPPLPLPPVAFRGRTLAEYARCFALDLTALRRRDVLDVAAGSSSFTAEACARGIDAVAVDPCYADGPDELSARVEGNDAATRFLADFAAQRFYGRYVAAALPHLPFFDETFDLVLCAGLLFGRERRFDFDWHVAACRELVRVSAAEVRLHRVVDVEGRAVPGVARLRRELKAVGVASELVRVAGQFAVGMEAMLVLKRVQS
ncbi:MAG: hypothetical protein RLZZ15_1385 [Verrucomicrobiota bacterium]|jgi:hypothetical protein